MEKIRDVVIKNGSLINDAHLKHLQSIWIKAYNSKGMPVFLTNHELHLVNEKLKALGEIKSFKDLPSSREMLTQDSPQVRHTPTNVYSNPRW